MNTVPPIGRLDNWSTNILLITLSTLAIFLYGVTNDIWLQRPERTVALEAVVLTAILAVAVRVTVTLRNKIQEQQEVFGTLVSTLALKLPETTGNRSSPQLYFALGLSEGQKRGASAAAIVFEQLHIQEPARRNFGVPDLQTLVMTETATQSIEESLTGRSVSCSSFELKSLNPFETLTLRRQGNYSDHPSGLIAAVGELQHGPFGNQAR